MRHVGAFRSVTVALWLILPGTVHAQQPAGAAAPTEDLAKDLSNPVSSLVTVTLTLQSEMTANWDAGNSGDTWTVPINFLVGKLASFGPFPASYQLGFGVFPAHPAIGPSWKIRGAIVLLLPRTRGRS